MIVGNGFSELGKSHQLWIFSVPSLCISNYMSHVQAMIDADITGWSSNSAFLAIPSRGVEGIGFHDLDERNKGDESRSVSAVLIFYWWIAATPKSHLHP